MTYLNTPQSWSHHKLSELVFFQRGFDITQAEQKPGDIPVISSSGVSSHHSAFKAEGPGVVIGRKGTLGKVHFVDENYWPHDTTLWSKDLKGNNPRFVYYFLQTLDFKRFDVGSSNPTLNRNHIHDLDVAIPPLSEQNRIAEYLCAYDDLIENNRRRMALLEESARLLYQEWFVHLRFPGHEHARITDGVPEGWALHPLRELARINQQNLNSNFDGVIEYIDIASVTPNSINETTTYDFRDAPSRARRVVQHGDILWSCVRPNRRSHAAVWHPPENMVASTGFAVISPCRLPTSFLYQAVSADSFVGYLENHAKGAAYPAVVAGDFERATILAPTSLLVDAFNEFAEPLLAQAHSLKQQNQKLRTARDLLLPRLMSGKISV